MRVLKKNILNVLLSFVMVFSFVFAGWGGLFSAMKATADSATLESEFIKDGQFNVSQFGNNTLEYVEGINGAEDAVLKINVNGAGSAYIIFNAPQVQANMVESIVVSIYSPEYSASDSFRASNSDLSAGWQMNEAKDMSSWCEVTLSDSLLALMVDENGYLSKQVAFGARVHGTASVYYIDSITINMKKDLTGEFTNDGQFVVDNYNDDAVNYPYEFVDGEKEGLLTGYTGAVAKIGSKINGGAAYINIDFTASQISAADVESVVARVYSPDYTAADELRINNVGGYIASADLSNWCNVVIPVANITGNDGNLGSFAFGLRDKGTVSDYFYIDSITVNMKKPPVPVTFTHINPTWNDNTDILNNGMHYTVLHLSGLQTSGYLGQGDDWSDMLANATINGGASYFNFSAASYIAGPNVASDFIVLYSATAPTLGDEFIVKAGATFDVGGDDTNIYQLSNDIRLIYNGTAWALPASATYYVVETAEGNGIIHTCSTYQNADGSFTYTLPEYTMEGKTLLGYALTEGGVEKMLPVGEYTSMDGSGLIFSALWAEFTMVEGAAIRIASAETSGIRWTTNIDEAGFNNILYWTKGNYQFGTELSTEGFAENFDIVTKIWKVENRQYTGVLTDINANYYTKVFTARGYVDVTYSNGETKRIYATANDTTRSIKQVAELAIASGDYSGTQLSILQQIAGV